MKNHIVRYIRSHLTASEIKDVVAYELRDILSLKIADIFSADDKLIFDAGDFSVSVDTATGLIAATTPSGKQNFTTDLLELHLARSLRAVIARKHDLIRRQI